jgi:hypothetical protein
MSFFFLYTKLDEFIDKQLQKLKDSLKKKIDELIRDLVGLNLDLGQKRNNVGHDLIFGELKEKEIDFLQTQLISLKPFDSFYKQINISQQ